MHESNVRKNIRFVLAALSVSLFVWLLRPTLMQWDAALFTELLRAVKEVNASISEIARGSVAQLSFAELMAATFCFSASSAWVAYRLTTTTTLFLLVQLCVLSLVFQSVAWRVANVEGYPISYLISIGLGAVVGLILKRIDENHLAAEALRVELELRNRELLESRLAIVKQDERERRLLAADLHDQVLNDLKKISLEVEALVPQPEAKSGIQVQQSLKNVMRDVREIMDNLCPVVLDHFGLTAAVEECLEKGSQRSGFDFKLEVRAPEEKIKRLSAVENQLLFRLIQESITNICKHAEATHVAVTFEDAGNQLIVSIEDNGKGLAKDAVAQSSRGLLYMKLRAALIGAQVHWLTDETRPGTRVEIRTMPERDKTTPS